MIDRSEQAVAVMAKRFASFAGVEFVGYDAPPAAQPPLRSRA
jgi:hypothetical protein